MDIKILGGGCASCKKLYENTKKAVEEVGVQADIEYITDMKRVMTYGVMSMPALVVNDKVVAMGKILKPGDVARLLKKVGN